MNSQFTPDKKIIRFIMICLSCLVVFKPAHGKSEDFVYDKLNMYVDAGLVVDDVLGPIDSVITVSGDFFTYEVGTTEDVSEQLSQAIDKRDSDIKFNRNLSPTEYLNEIISMLTTNTQYENNFQINKKPSPQALNIYFLKDDPANLVSHFDNNCAYIGWLNAIICDAVFLKKQIDSLTAIKEFHNIAIVNFEEQRRLTPAELDPETREMINNLIRGSFLTWYLGHEIGHAVLHKEYVTTTGNVVHFSDPEYDHRELEADIFVANTLSRPSSLTINFWTMIGEFIEHEYRNAYQQLAPQGRTKEVNPESSFFPIRYAIEIEYSQYQMPLLLRSLRIIDVLTQQSPGLDSTGYYQQVRRNVKATRAVEDVALEWGIILAIGLLGLAAIGFIFSAWKRRTK